MTARMLRDHVVVNDAAAVPDGTSDPNRLDFRDHIGIRPSTLGPIRQDEIAVEVAPGVDLGARRRGYSEAQQAEPEAAQAFAPVLRAGPPLGRSCPAVARALPPVGLGVTNPSPGEYLFQSQ